MTSGRDPNVDPFVQDALHNKGYLYSTNAQLSSRLANRRITDVTLDIADLRRKRVLDIGCGDGMFTQELVELGESVTVHGVDPAVAALAVARSKVHDPRLQFVVSSAYHLPYPDDCFDAAHLRGVLHHMNDPIQALREALRVAGVVVVIEPNGYNPGLKVLERCSRYHVEHGEKSYAPWRLERWIGDLGARIERRTWAGLVPMFSPDWCAKAMKRLEPVVEQVPVLRAGVCAVFAFTAIRVRGRGGSDVSHPASGPSASSEAGRGQAGQQ
ncbi:MAG: class I SAM-dependent methyltransferase [Actinomycetota bacterium]|nr:class I SAM-dependent methyltransferase [Actinomycetota bacterium]